MVKFLEAITLKLIELSNETKRVGVKIALEAFKTLISSEYNHHLWKVFQKNVYSKAIYNTSIGVLDNTVSKAKGISFI